MCKRKTKSNRLHTNDTYFKKAKNTLSETYPFKKKRGPIKESLLAGWLAGLLAGSPACIIVSGNDAHLLHCFPAVFLLLCFGSCLIVLGGCLGDARSIARSLDRLIARSLGRSLDRSIARSLDRSIARSLGRSLDRSIARSLDRSIARSLDRSLDRSFDYCTSPKRREKHF
jgi:hypothetical protein